MERWIVKFGHKHLSWEEHPTSDARSRVSSSEQSAWDHATLLSLVKVNDRAWWIRNRIADGWRCHPVGEALP